MNAVDNLSNNTVENTAQGEQKQSAIQSVALLLAFFRMPANSAALERELTGDTIDSGQLVRLFRQLDLKSSMVSTSIERLEKTPLSAVARMNDDHFVVVGKVAEGKVVMQDALSGQVLAPTLAEFIATWSGELILVTRRAKLLGAGSKFDISWFIPAFLKYRKIIGEVLIASLFLQLFMLVTPLFFQVVMGKVLVHHSLSTLNIIVFGMVVIAIFEVVLGGLRTYIFLFFLIQLTALTSNSVQNYSAICWRYRWLIFSRGAPVR